MPLTVKWDTIFEGEGGGKGGSSHTPTEAPDSLFSNATGAIVDLISEGEIEGLVDGDKSIYFNEVALLSDDGVTPNFVGATVYMNHGTDGQPAIPGFDDVRTSVAVSQDLPYNIYKTISFPNDGTITAVAITIAANSFFEVQSDGDVVGTSVTFVIEKSENGSSFAPVVNGTISGKQRNEYDIDFRVGITDTGGNTAIRVKRTKPDATSLQINDVITFKLYTKIVEHKLAYPSRAVVGSLFDAKQFGNQLPSRAYHVKGIKVKVPHNYDPVKRTYTGTFTGALTTSKVYTNNPAWIFYDLLTSQRYGLGQYFDNTLVDIPSLYTLGKWCDDFVADGVSTTKSVSSITRTSSTATVTCTAHGFSTGDFIMIAGATQTEYDGTFHITVVDANTFTYAVSGTPATPATGTKTAQKREPRWVCNAYINSRDDAFNVLKELASIFRGVLFWMDGKLWAQADLPRDPVKLVTNANVIDGVFTYSGESNRSRNSVVNVSWNDPLVFYRRAIESYEDPDLIRELGWRATDVVAVGCTSRAQARRLAKAIIFSQEYESELVTYQASFDHMAVDGDGPTGVAPGDVVLIADHERGNAVGGGRIVTVTDSSHFVGVQDITECDWTGTGTGTVYLEHAATGTVEYKACTYSVSTGVVHLTATPTEPIAVNDIYVLLDAGFDAEPFRVIKVSEVERNILEIAAARYDSGKFADIYGEFQFHHENIMRVGNGTFIAAPTGLTATEGYIYNAGLNTRTLELSWNAVIDPYLDYYLVTWVYNNDTPQHIIANSTTARIVDVRDGTYHISVQAVNRLGVYSLPDSIDVVTGVVPPGLPEGSISNVVLLSGGTQFVGKDAAFGWEVDTPTGSYFTGVGATSPTTGIPDPTFLDCVVYMRRPDDTLLRTESVVGTSYTYTYEKNYDDTGGLPIRDFKIEVTYRDIYSRESLPAGLEVNNPAPNLPAVITQVQNGIFTMSYIPDADPDFAGIVVWMSTTSGFPVDDTTKIWQDRGNPALPIGSGYIYYYRYAGYDGFGTAGLNVSDEYALDLSSGGSGDGSTSSFVEIFKRSPTVPTNPSTSVWKGPVLFDSRHQTWVVKTTATTSYLLSTDSLKYDDGTYVAPTTDPAIPSGWSTTYPDWNTDSASGPVWRLTTGSGSGSGSGPVLPPAGSGTYTVNVGHVSGPVADFYGFENDGIRAYGTLGPTTQLLSTGMVIIALCWENIHATDSRTLFLTVSGTHTNSGWTSISIDGHVHNRADATFGTGGGNTTWSWTSTNNFDNTEGVNKPVVIMP